MKTLLNPDGSLGASRVVDSGCTASRIQPSAWEYKVAIASASATSEPLDVREQFLNDLGKNGWTFVRQNQGISYFKRLKKQRIPA